MHDCSTVYSLAGGGGCKSICVVLSLSWSEARTDGCLQEGDKALSPGLRHSLKVSFISSLPAAPPPHHKVPPYSGHALADVICVFSKLERRGNHHVSCVTHRSWMRLPFTLLLI